MEKLEEFSPCMPQVVGGHILRECAFVEVGLIRIRKNRDKICVRYHRIKEQACLNTAWVLYGVEARYRTTYRVRHDDEAETFESAALEFIPADLGEELVKIGDRSSQIVPIGRAWRVAGVRVGLSLAVAVVAEQGGHGGHWLAGLGTEVQESVHRLDPCAGWKYQAVEKHHENVGVGLLEYGDVKACAWLGAQYDILVLHVGEWGGARLCLS